MFESLESRRFLSATGGFVPPDGVFRITGSELADRIEVYRTTDNVLVVEHVAGNVNPKTGAFSATVIYDYFPVHAASIKRLVIDGGSGDDVIDVRDAGKATEARGGQGNDVLLGGAKNDFLQGGFGDDTLRGGAGADHLDGNDGNDLLFGQQGSDALFGGRGRDYLDGGEDASRDRYDGDDGDDTAVVRVKPISIRRVERVLVGWE